MSQTTSSAKTVNVAVVGLGFMGVTHLRAHLDHPQATVVAVCDGFRLPVNGVLAGVAGNIQNSGDIHLGEDVKGYKTFDELLADPNVELIDICTPTPMHAEQTIAALKAGKHVLCEKPLARTSEEARKIVDVAKESKGFLMPAMCMRFWPGWAWLKQVVVAQTYGKVLSAQFRRVSEMPAWSRNGTYAGGTDLGGALFDLHIHDTDFVNHLFGRPASVFASGVMGGAGEINHVVTQYTYPQGPAVHAEGSWLLTKGFNMSYVLLCERATIDYDMSRGDKALIVTEEGQEARVVAIEAGDGYAGEINYFIDCVVNGRAPAVVTPYAGCEAIEICEAEEASIRGGKVVTL